MILPRQEAVAREVVAPDVLLTELTAQPRHVAFAFPEFREVEPLRGPDGQIAGAVVRSQRAVAGTVELSAAGVAEGLFRATVRVLNVTQPADASGGREEALLYSLISTHAILSVREGAFVSLLDPPEEQREAAAACRNVGLWPVLVGEAGDADAMLASPIILYDHPQIAPESPGDLFDGTEIDEILTLRILTLTEEEKKEMSAGDERARALLARTEALDRDQLMRLHGTIRGLKPLAKGDGHD
jgi:hydrogenase maturation protease